MLTGVVRLERCTTPSQQMLSGLQYLLGSLGRCALLAAAATAATAAAADHIETCCISYQQLIRHYMLEKVIISSGHDLPGAVLQQICLGVYCCTGVARGDIFTRCPLLQMYPSMPCTHLLSCCPDMIITGSC
jgi:hypothetical protein